MDYGFAAFCGFIAGVLLMALVVSAVVPNTKQECDAFGMARLGGQVYACSPKSK
jgi:hypothetical protein